MANTPSSLEVQIDNFLEHFKRSASKAMDSDWITTEHPSNYATTTATTAASFYQSSALRTAKSRSSCFDISQLSSISGTPKSMKTILTMWNTIISHPKTKSQYVGYLFEIDRYRAINTMAYMIRIRLLVLFKRIHVLY